MKQELMYKGRSADCSIASSHWLFRAVRRTSVHLIHSKLQWINVRNSKRVCEGHALICLLPLTYQYHDQTCNNPALPNFYESTTTAVDQSDYRTMNSDQDSASLPDSLDQISIGRDAVATTSAEVLPTLLSVPLEIRRSIYQCFLKADKSATANLEDNTAQLDFAPLHICRQLRAEALEYLAKNNTWTRLSNPSDQNIKLSYATWRSPQIPLDLLPQQEREVLLSEIALEVTLRQTTSIHENGSASKLKQDVLVCFATASHVFLCESLLVMTETPSIAVSITLASKSSALNRTTIEELILPFASGRDATAAPNIEIRGVPNWRLRALLASAVNRTDRSARDFQDHLLALKEEADRFFAEGHTSATLLYHSKALDIFRRLTGGAYRPAPASAGELNTIRSIFVDICNDMTHNLNSIVASHRDTTGALHVDSITTILDVFLFARGTTDWTIMSDQQRQTTHYRRAVTMHNLAEYCSRPECLPYALAHHNDMVRPTYLTQTRLQYVATTREYYFAWKADTKSERAQFLEKTYNELSRKYDCFTEDDDPDMIVIDKIPNYGAGAWKGDPAALIGSNMEKFKLELEKSVPRESNVMTKKELKKLKRALGMPGRRRDGFLRLLRPAETEDTIHKPE